MIRFWRRKHSKKFSEAVKIMIRKGCGNWKKAETVLIKKGDKERYDQLKS